MAKHGADEGWRQHVINNVLPRMEATSPAGTAGFEPGLQTRKRLALASTFSRRSM